MRSFHGFVDALVPLLESSKVSEFSEKHYSNKLSYYLILILTNRTPIETPSRFGPHLDKLMPVLYWFAWIGQHGRPVLPPGTVGVAAHATHPYNLVMTDAERRRGEGTQGEKQKDKAG